MATLKELFAEVDANAQTLKRMVAEDLGHQVSVTMLYQSAGTAAARDTSMMRGRGRRSSAITSS